MYAPISKIKIINLYSLFFRQSILFYPLKYNYDIKSK